MECAFAILQDGFQLEEHMWLHGMTNNMKMNYAMMLLWEMLPHGGETFPTWLSVVLIGMCFQHW